MHDGFAPSEEAEVYWVYMLCEARQLQSALLPLASIVGHLRSQEWAEGISVRKDCSY